MDPEQQLTASLAIHTIHNLRPPLDTPRISPHVLSFIRDVLHREIETLLAQPVIQPPVVPDDLPLADYFVSSSHNTYLLSGQILGRSSALSYKHVLSRGARCVEIDVWPSKNGPIVTHGYTLSQSIPFTDTCAAIGSSLSPTSWPVLVSLECHVYGEESQEELVRIMRDAWGDKLIEGKLSDVDDDAGLTPAQVRGKVLVMVEYYPPPASSLVSGEAVDSDSSDSSSPSSEGGSNLWPIGRKRSRIPPHLRISPLLAAMGHYLRSMKPRKGWHSQLFPDPPHILLNISESSLLSLLTSVPNAKTPSHGPILNQLITHAQSHIRRIYPKGTRISSSNLRSYTFWGTGSHVVAVNWQKYDTGMQVNEAMFVGTEGYVVKPAWMRGDTRLRLGERISSAGGLEEGNPEEGRKLRIKAEIVGVSSVPPPSDRQRTPEAKPYNAYLKAQLFLPTPSAVPTSASLTVKAKAKFSNELEYTTKSQKVLPINGDLDFAYPKVNLTPSCPEDVQGDWESQKELWWGRKQKEQGLESASFEWTIYEKWEEITFLKFSICESELGRDDRLAVFCARVADIRRALEADASKHTGDSGGAVAGWRAVRLLDLAGKNCGAIVLVRFTFESVL